MLVAPSFLKLTTAKGISKGTIGLYTTMILGERLPMNYPGPTLKTDLLSTAAHAASPATAEALMHELNASQPAVLQKITKSVPGMLPKGQLFFARYI